MTAYEMRISDWSSDVCSSDLSHAVVAIPVRSALRSRTARMCAGRPRGSDLSRDDFRFAREESLGKGTAFAGSSRARIGQVQGGSGQAHDPAQEIPTAQSDAARRSEHSRVGKEGGRKVRSGRTPY